jgi:hypothetical protein
MVRLPTLVSRGRANLHLGAVGAGVDLMSGRTVGGVCRNRAVDVHPDTGVDIRGVEIPGWRRLLESSMHLSDGIGLGYLGVDFALDAAQGPVVLEANARPGLSIQVANGCGLLPRLQAIEERAQRPLPHEERLEIMASLPPAEREGEAPAAPLTGLARGARERQEASPPRAAGLKFTLRP